MSTLVTVRANLRPTEVHAFPMENGLPAPDGEWTLIETLQPGQTGEYFTHSRRMICAQVVPNLTT